MDEDETVAAVRVPVTVRCGFCLTLNRVDLTRAEERPACGTCHRPILLDRPVAVSQDDFERTVLASAAPVLVDFYADWCAPCRMVAPVVDEIAHHHTGRLLVTRVDTDRAPDLAGRLGIRGIPALVFFKDGVEVGRSVGFDPDRLRTLTEEMVR